MPEHKPLYLYSLKEAAEWDEKDEWRESHLENCDCARAIERAIDEHYDGQRLNSCAQEIIDRYGFDRVNFVLAATVRQGTHDGRYSEDNKKWSKRFSVMDKENAWQYHVRSHPGLVNLFVADARRLWDKLGLFDGRHCENGSQVDYTDRIVVLDPSILKDECKTPQDQLFYAESGNGCRPNAIGTKVGRVKVVLYMAGKRNFSQCLSHYFSVYLPGLRNVSQNTIYSYRDTFCLFLTFCKDFKHINLLKLNFEIFNSKLINEFMNWLEIERRNSISTLNQRLAAIRSFFRYAQCEFPQYFVAFEDILSIPFRKTEQTAVDYLPKEVLTKYLSLPDCNTISGRRDFALLCTLYDTGARVQELVDLKIKDVRLEEPPVIKLTGKGRKTRVVPIMPNTKEVLLNYLTERNLNNSSSFDMPLFVNRQNHKMTRAGIAYIVNKYAVKLEKQQDDLFSDITPHILRHSKAMHLLQANVNIIYIRDFLGHTDVKTTEIYARADTEMKRKALEKVQSLIPDKTNKSLWSDDKDLLNWLNSLGRNPE